MHQTISTVERKALPWATTNMMDMLAFWSLVRKFDCDICFTPMIVAPDCMCSVKARDSEFTNNEGLWSKVVHCVWE
uniref:Uncharacterized protein n=1 Tax=Oncorhynchus tshawytscha TaxID=74940 RepID=A0A8C8F9H4_ONCTS